MNRDQINKFLDVMDHLTEEEATLTIYQNGKINLSVYPKNWYQSGNHWSEEKRHSMLSLITPLVGKLVKHISDRNIGYSGENENVTVRLCYIDQCKIVGYKKVTKTVRREIERPTEYEEEEVTENIPITDCDIRVGKFKEDDIEVPA